jgi:hypothetical protein
MAYQDLMGMGPLRPDEIEAIFVRGRIRWFIREYLKETQGQKLEDFDRLDLSSQKELLKSKYGSYGYKSNKGTLVGLSKSILRMQGKRTNNNARAEEDFIKAREEYLKEKKENDLKRDQTFKAHLYYFENNDRIPTPGGGRIYFLSFLNKLPETNTRTLTMQELSEDGKYKPDENIPFSQDLLNIFPGSTIAPVAPVAPVASVASVAPVAPVAPANQRAGKRRNAVTKKVRRNKGKKTRKN